jgi:diaminopimelate epimerase
MIEYAKLHACGNDFLIVEATPRSDEDERTLAIALCARTTGAGADGVEFLTWPGEKQTGEENRTDNHKGTIRLRNADGGIAEISGNGTRCVAAWMAHKQNAAPGATFILTTDAGPRTCTLVSRKGATGLFRTTMGIPTTDWAAVELPELGIAVEGAVVSTGNPHFVLRVDDEQFQVQGIAWQQISQAVCFHPNFPRQTNVEFIRVVSSSEVELRIFERGVGPTTSSGTGTCAAATAAIHFHNCNRNLYIHAPGGTQQVAWPANEQEIELTGPATLIATGTAFIEEPGPQ